MAVYKRTYQRYDGGLTPAWSRFLVIPRYAFEEMRRSKFLVIFFVISMLAPLVDALVIYLVHNLAVLQTLRIRPVQINAQFFMSYLGFQSVLAFFMTAFVGPGLISPDLANNGLPLYLARPFSRTEYVLGKMSVLILLLSAMTWIPGLLLFALQSYMEGWAWMTNNLNIAAGLSLGAWIWILILSLLALAISAWVKWKPAAAVLMFGVFFIAAGFGGAINEVLRTKWGNLFSVPHLIGEVWLRMFSESSTRGGAMFFRVREEGALPLWCCWAALIGICLFCLYLLSRRIRGTEVVR